MVRSSLSVRTLRSSPPPSLSPSPCPVRSPCDTRAYVHANSPAYTYVMHVYQYVHETTKRATFRRACFLRVSAPVGQTNRPAPTSSDQPVRRPLRLRARSLARWLTGHGSLDSRFFPLIWVSRYARVLSAPQVACASGERKSGFISGVALPLGPANRLSSAFSSRLSGRQ